MKNQIGSNEVLIGRQVWMKKNLGVEQFRNGDVILQARSNQEWVSAGKNQMPVWCYYENSEKRGSWNVCSLYKEIDIVKCFMVVDLSIVLGGHVLKFSIIITHAFTYFY